MGVYRNYARRPRMGLYVGLVALFALGLMAKPQIITLPFVLLLWDYWPLRRMFAPAAADAEFAPQPLSYLVMEKLPLFALSAASAVVTMIAQKSGGAVVSFQKFPLGVRFGNACVSYARYLGKLIWPVHLALFYPHPGSLALSAALLSLLLLLAISAAVYVYRRHRYLPMGWLWFLGTSVPMIGLVQVSRQAMADRYAYLTFIGPFIAVCWGVADLAEHLRIPARALQVASAVVLLALSVQSYRQIGYWADNMTLWTHALDVTSGNYMANNIVGSLLMDQGRMDDALAHFQAARAINPADPAAYMYIGIYRQEHGQPREALAEYQKLIDMTNDSIALNLWFRADTYVRMALAYHQLGDMAKAQECLREDLKLRPDNGPSWAALGVIAQTSGDMDTAIADYRQSVKVHPTDVAYVLLARALQKQGDTAGIQAAVQAAQKLSKGAQQTAKMTNQVFAQWAVPEK
jgi:tetratricopeptide (TPR) repeat protein